MPLDSECPCCAPPWAFTHPPAPRSVYAGGLCNSIPNHTVVRYRSSTGLPNSQIATPVSVAGVFAICCDTSGNLYYSDDATIVAVTEGGTARWTASHSANITGLAVTADGWLYATGGTDITKWNTTTGVQNTTGWPHTWGGTQLFAVCVDQSGNVYACGTSNGTPSQVVSLDSGGTPRWEAAITSATATTLRGRGIAIDHTNTLLAVAGEITNIITDPIATAKNCLTLSAVNGGLVNSFARGGQTYHAAYGPTGIRYFCGQVNAAGYYLRKITSDYYSPSDLGPGTYWIDQIAIGMDGSEFVIARGTTNTPSDPVRKINGTPWAKEISSSANAGGYSICHSLGLVGAFGVR